MHAAKPEVIQPISTGLSYPRRRILHRTFYFDYGRPHRPHKGSIVPTISAGRDVASGRMGTPGYEDESSELNHSESVTRPVSSHLARAYPLAAVVDLDHIKQALILGAVDTGLGGIAISGRRGTAKSICARGLQALMPPIEVVQGSFCNADPANPGEWEDGLAEKLAGRPEIPTCVRDAPFVQIPLGVTEDRLVGTVDIEASMKAGRAVFQPGLLAEAHRGILYVDEINLLDEGLANMLLNVVSEGVNVVEREGISISHPCRPLLIATYNPEEGTLREHLLDRIAVTLSADVPLTFERRVEAVEAATRFQNHAGDVLQDTEDATQELKTQILFAREFLPNVRMSRVQVDYLVQEASRGGVLGHRGEIFACRVAKASAAMEGRDTVRPVDLQRAVELVIVPRSTVIQVPPEQMPQPGPPPPQLQTQETKENKEEEEQNEQDQDQIPDQIPQEFIFDPEGVVLDPTILLFAKRQKRTKGRTGRAKSSIVYSEDRGRYVKSMFPKGGKVKRLAVDATLRAAAPYQMARRLRLKTKGTPGKKVYIEKGDMRAKRLARKAGALVVFLVDASGSMALNRMASAKGAALRLLAESYRNRDFVSVIPFYGSRAEVLLPPSKSVAMATRRLESLPCGGGTLLAHALSLAIRTGLQALHGGTVGRVVVVLITDGRANISLAKSNENPDAVAPDAPKPTQEQLKEEAIDMAKRLGSFGLHLLVIDTECKYITTGLAEEIAAAADGTYFRLPNATEKAVAAATATAMAETQGL